MKPAIPLILLAIAMSFAPPALAQDAVPPPPPSEEPLPQAPPLTPDAVLVPAEEYDCSGVDFDALPRDEQRRLKEVCSKAGRDPPPDKPDKRAPSEPALSDSTTG